MPFVLRLVFATIFILVAAAMFDVGARQASPGVQSFFHMAIGVVGVLYAKYCLED